jgi:DNA (cytosine-5)-methyltransferase 1
MGYYRAGFTVTGVDIKPQPHYPFTFIQDDAIEYIKEHGHKYDALVGSPPCQAWSLCQRIQGNEHPDLISALREVFIASGKPWVIENVEGAPLNYPVTLCGAWFGLKTYRHRIFESNIFIPQPPHLEHRWPIAKMGRPPKSHEFMHIVGNFSGVQRAREIMDIDWMTREELREAIPPAYTEYIGKFLIQAVGG